MRQKGLARLRLSPLFSIRNIVFTFAVFMSALLWSRQYGLVSSFDISATQMTTNFAQASKLPSVDSSDTANAQHEQTHAQSEQNTSLQKDATESGSKTVLEEQSGSDGNSDHANKTDERHEHAESVRDEQGSYQSHEEHNINSQKYTAAAANTADRAKVQAESNESEDVSHLKKENNQQHGTSQVYTARIDDVSGTKAKLLSSEEKADKSVPHEEGSAGSESDVSESRKGTNVAPAAAIASPPLQEPEKTLAEVLNFTPATAINFMHFHKTGGVSFKTSLHKFYYEKYKKNGEKVRVRDACYSRKNSNADPSTPSFMMWRCDWDPIREMSESERNKLDFTFGHQFWGNGVGTLLNKRDVRSFTIMRHPFDRKVSFFYHFFVREVGRREEDITFEEIRDFLLYDKLAINADLGRDLGPNYMAGRLLSDGVQGYVGNNSFRYYDVEPHRKREVAEEALKLVRDYVFVGLQVESGAAKCMLKKVVEQYNNVNDVDNSNLELIDDGAEKLNSGSYSLGAKRIWGMFSDEERTLFDRKEKVDLLIYEEGERLFKKHVKLFGCSDRIVAEKYMS
ncbi:hypothetical protein BWQ96_03886 [Gracilariopsis chorda]|uniref:Uncharacterized protein n=1 Tax=Gracilariopsis chorda TaxID=448386 RepID=A0A2V3IXG8_9FLOR|nr:hypothetical protein BWQ96_03886 [Gracilariopsis chorda]|eukprot:PXF46387.1 hypothetical protein BWQ96_03886 [Gracilariopsis chorda]